MLPMPGGMPAFSSALRRGCPALLALILIACGDHQADSPQQGAPVALTLSEASVIYPVNQPIVPITPSPQTGTTGTYAVSPALPPGLLLDPATGVISGTPTTVTPAISHTITDSTAGEVVATGIEIAIAPQAVAPAGLAYTAQSDIVYTVG